MHRFAEVREAVGLAAGDEHLPGADLVQHKILPPRVQLRQHIVQQQHRLFAGVAAQQLPLGELETDGRRARLPMQIYALFSTIAGVWLAVKRRVKEAADTYDKVSATMLCIVEIKPKLFRI